MKLTKYNVIKLLLYCIVGLYVGTKLGLLFELLIQHLI